MNGETAMLMTMAILCAAAFGMFFTVPFFARRFPKFMPADAGTAVVRAFHIPRFASPENDPERRKLRKKLWLKLIGAGFLWGIFGAGSVLFMIREDCSLTFVLMLWISGLLASIDEKIHLLPDVLTIPLMISGFLFSACSVSGVTPVASACGAAAGFLMPTLAAVVITPFRPRAMGFGDFKMLAGLGAWTGFPVLSVTIFLSFVFFVLIAAAKRSKTGPYGFSLFFAQIAALILNAKGVIDLLFFVV